ncbi:hypothetical protein [Aureispira anguillae]|uniref:Uncharacterized protein n=1 Tax=Aureispira anguillae TaxID=2864201 RepID=A0A915YFW6_9BACT|nr:hypothetical protein [Aureispira anguillae]BDS12410.1 hypothetical protein AsAng_0031310 [Aureispira anguillae]
MKYVLLIVSLLLFAVGTTDAQMGKGKGLVKKTTDEVEAKGKEKAAEMKEKGKGKAKKEAGKVVGADVANTAVEKGDDLVHKGKDAALDKIKKGKEKEHKENGNHSEKKDKVAEKGKGHAYGKNKGDLSGKEFGQARAAEAKLKNETKKKEAKTSIQKGEDTVTKAKDKIAAAKEQLEKDFTDKKLTQEEYTAKKDKIALIEEKAAELQEELKKGKKITQKSK